MTFGLSHCVCVAAVPDTDRLEARRDVLRRERRADARADLADTPTAVLLAKLGDCRRDLAPRRADGRRRLPPLWWPASAVEAGRIRAALRERGTKGEARASPEEAGLRRPRRGEGA